MRLERLHDGLRLRVLSHLLSNLRILQEGSVHKFVEAVEQVTFSGHYAALKKQPVLYITERCVFELTEAGMCLTEIAPGVDVARDILAHMGFRPIIADTLKTMDARIFQPDSMCLRPRSSSPLRSTP